MTPRQMQDYVDCAAQFGPVREAYGLLVQAEADANKAWPD